MPFRSQPPLIPARRRTGVARGVPALTAGIAVVLALASYPCVGRSQTPLDSLVSRAMSASPRLRAARERARGADARIAPAATRPDPLLMIGVQNFPVSEPGFSDFMTMKTIGVGQTIPYPGKLGSARRAAESAARAARVEVDAVALAVSRDVRSTYFDIAYLDQALAIVARTRDVLVTLISATEARYEAGMPGQADVLRARLEATRLGDEASMLLEERRATVARLNSLLDRESDAPVEGATIPPGIARAAVAAAPERIQFVSATLGSRAADSPLPRLDSLLAIAVKSSPMVRAQDAMVAAEAARVESARLDRRPDVDVSLEYGQRNGLSDMLTARLSVPMPIKRRRRQDQLLIAARAELAGAEAESHRRRNDVRTEVARLYTRIERDRTQLALTVKAMLPQSRATLESAMANYQAGRAPFVAVLEAQALLFNSETTYHRALSDFAKALAELDEVVGSEVLP